MSNLGIGYPVPFFLSISREANPVTTLRFEKENGRRPADNYTPIVTIHADASCLRNGAADSSAGGGAVIVDRNRMEVKLVARYLGTITNQQAEILACVTALEELRRPCRVEILSDSRYVIDTMNGRNRMKTNRAFWGRLIERSYGHHITWRWVKGHDGITFQEAADRLARAVATARTDLLLADLDFLADHLSNESNQLSIRSFGIELDKIVSRYDQVELIRPVTTTEGLGAYPSAFLG